MVSPSTAFYRKRLIVRTHICAVESVVYILPFGQSPMSSSTPHLAPFLFLVPAEPHVPSALLQWGRPFPLQGYV